MTPSEVLIWAGLTGLISALATGLGAIPAALVPNKSQAARAFTSAFAAGMMVSASVFTLAQEGIDLQREGRSSAPYEVIAGMLAGGAFFWAASRYVDRVLPAQGHAGNSKRTVLLFIAMFVHSAPEGVAIGVGFATGKLEFGLLVAIAIAVHNIPEGVAISLPVRAEGGSVLRCAGLSIASSLPQPLLAPVAAGLVWVFDPLLAGGMGFAAGAMIYLVTHELIPEALAESDRATCSWGVLSGLCGMLLLTTLIERFTGG